MISDDKIQLVEAAIEKIQKGELVEFKLKSKDAGLCLGDLTEIGWAERCTWQGGMQWHYVGPGAIKVENDVVVSGDYTKELNFTK